MPEKLINPNASLTIPKWVNQDYFKVVLDKDEPEYKKVTKFTPMAAIPPGENFTSIILRIYIDLEMNDGSTKQKTYILKTMLPHEKGGKEMAEFGLFPKEFQMYSLYLPAFERLYKIAGRDVQLAPKCLYTEERKDGINFVFKDMKEQDFQNIDRIKGFDMAHMRRVLEKLAELHAASAVYAAENGLYPKEFDEGLVTYGAKDFIVNGLEVRRSMFMECMKTWGMQNSEKYSEKFPTKKQFWQLNLKALQAYPNDFNVLTHGDFWSSNMMFNYHPDGSIKEILLVDFQVCKWGSPAEDLTFIIITSAAEDIRLKEYDHFIEIYHEKLIDCLQVLRYKKPLPQLRDIQKAIYNERNTFFVFFALYNHLPIVKFPADTEISLHLLVSEGEAADVLRRRLYTHPTYANIMKELYPFFCRRGLLNFNDFDEVN